jgi:hypothetical protein
LLRQTGHLPGDICESVLGLDAGGRPLAAGYWLLDVMPDSPRPSADGICSMIDGMGFKA